MPSPFHLWDCGRLPTTDAEYHSWTTPQTALYGSSILVTGHLILAAVLSLYRSGSLERTGTTTGPEPEDGADRDAETVTCPSCGAESELDDRYCAR